MNERKEHWSNVVPNFNRTYTYIFPMLGQNKNQFKNVKSCFIGDEEKPQFNKHIFLLHNFSGDIEYSRYEKFLIKHPQFIEQYSPDSETDMFVFSVPDMMIEDYEKILNSKYSRISQRYKQHIIQFHSPYIGNIKDKAFFKVLYRHKDLRIKIESDLKVKLTSENEVSSLMDLNKEIFKKWMKIPENIPQV